MIDDNNDSSPCFLGQSSPDIDPRYFGRDITPPVQINAIQYLLSVERAGLKVAAESLAEAETESDRTMLEKIRAGEAESCKVLRAALDDLGVKPSLQIGDFYRKAMTIEDLSNRLAFIDRGREWVVRHIEKTINEYRDQHTHQALLRVLELHRPK